MAGAAFAALLSLTSTAAAQEDLSLRVLDFAELDGWSDDRHDEALDVFTRSCDLIDGPEWPGLCELASRNPQARTFFELFFRPVLIEDGRDPLFTGYFEPEIDGARTRTHRFRVPVYSLPSGGTSLTRSEISQGALAGRGLEIAWVDDPTELFFLQVQGSGRIRLTNGQTIRIGYAGHNGHPYRSLGEALIARGTYEPHQVSADVIKNWVRRNPVEGQALLDHSPSYVFFRELPNLAMSLGPIGAMNRSITPMRSIAVDPSFVPLGAPVWIEKAGADPIHRLMIAQDTGSAIKGAQRADVFYGTGDKAGKQAGRIRDPGRVIVLLPIQIAYALQERAAG
ncbi:murein transglycosylase A [Celeribacter arenosi]|uniref:murein transglycosylase A n=1 Tax=Celeribacter arenosi TaxID=792649 RepID=UPI0031E47E75